MEITSVQNPKIKELLALQEKSRLRREKGLFVVEGQRELQHCMNAGYQVDTIFWCPEICGGTFGAWLSMHTLYTTQPAKDALVSPHGKSSASQTPPQAVPPLTWPRVAMDCHEVTHASSSEARVKVFEVSREVYAKVAYREGTEGVIAEVRAQSHSLNDLKLSDAPLLIVLESVEKPGNLGAVLRSADAAGADAVIICDPLTDIYNPNLIRASIGGVFTTQLATCESEEAIDWLKAQGIKILTAQLQDSEWYYDTDMKCGTAIVIGTEATGLTDVWRDAADAHIKIPMLGRLDSLNASVSAAILLFEAVRQRNSR